MLQLIEIGFDYTPSSRTRIIQGAKPGTNAWNAGVRDGQRWSARDLVGDATYPAEIEDENGKRRVRYYPASPQPYTVPQYTPTEATCATLP